SWFPITAYAQSDVPSATAVSSPTVAARNSYDGLILPVFALLVALCAVGLLLLEMKFGTISRVAKWAAKTLHELRLEISKSFSETFELQPAQFLVGCAMFLVVLYVIDHYYIALLAGVAQKVTTLARREAKGLALWIIIIVAFLGIAIDFMFKMWLKEREQ